MTTPTAAGAFGRESTVAGLLKATCVELTARLEADGCNLSRVIGQLLVDLAEHTPDGRRLQLGRGYLVPDYPVTQEVIERLEPRTLSLSDRDVDPGEAALLRELGFDSLLMVPFVLDDRCWGLVEVYRSGARPFDAASTDAALAIVADAATHIVALRRRAAA